MVTIIANVMLSAPGLFVGPAERRGRGVYSARDLNPGDVIEICPVIFIQAEDLSLIHRTVLHDYYFVWPGEEAAGCLALGYGSLYNHGVAPNASVHFNLGQQSLSVICERAIHSGDEVLIDYTGGLEDSPKLWFDPD